MKKLLSIILSAGIAVMMVTTNANAAGKPKDATDAKTVSTMEVLNKKGKLLYSVKRYGASQLPDEISSLVKSQYGDYNIIGVEEITNAEGDESVYFVHLEDETSLKTVKVVDGEMELTADFVRG